MLSKLHEMFNARLPWPNLNFRISNVGSRPADAALVVFESEGDFFLVPPKHKDTDDIDATIDDKKLIFPRPPATPKGTWKRTDPYGAILGTIAHFQSLTGRTSMGNASQTPLFISQPAPLDPNGFYFKEGRAGKPSKNVSFTCSQWRHANEPECFEIAVQCPRSPGLHAGLLKVTTHAANLTTPESLNLPIRITVVDESCLVFAEKMVAGLED